VNVRIVPVTVRLRRPFVTAWGAISERELLILELSDPDGMIGCGEAAPLPGYDGLTAAEVRAALEDCRPVLTRAVLPREAPSRETLPHEGLLHSASTRDVPTDDPADAPRAPAHRHADAPRVPADHHAHADILAACSERTFVPQALAAIDLALWDLDGRRSGQPVWRLLGASTAPAVEVNYTIGATDRAGAAAEAATARAAGFRCVKVKVGVGDDAGRIAAVRAAGGRDMTIRVDANGAWSVEEAEATLRVLAPAGIELCEEPVSDLDGLAALRAPVPVALDETAPEALDRRLADAVCLKVARCGGITGLIAAAERARAAGYDVYLASTLDGPLGIAAALHAAAAVKPDRPCGLATLSMFDAQEDPLPPRHGVITAPADPGLGDFPRWYEGLAEKATK
jgi:L-alanine-DL-glutamate epimerase-like enolase superfamily enzyme